MVAEQNYVYRLFHGDDECTAGVKHVKQICK